MCTWAPEGLKKKKITNVSVEMSVYYISIKNVMNKNWAVDSLCLITFLAKLMIFYIQLLKEAFIVFLSWYPVNYKVVGICKVCSFLTNLKYSSQSFWRRNSETIVRFFFLQIFHMCYALLTFTEKLPGFRSSNHDWFLWYYFW